MTAGSAVSLRGVRDGDFDILRAIRMDHAIQDALMAYPPDECPSDAEVREWIERRANDENGGFFSIDMGAQCVGFAQITSIHWKARIAHLGICIAMDMQGKGVGTGALRLLLEAAKRRIPEFHKAIAEIREDNTASLRLFERTGFRRVGILSSHYKGKNVALLEFMAL